MEYKADSIDSVEPQIALVLKELESLRSLLVGIEEKYNKDDPELIDLLGRVTDVGYQADYLIDCILNMNGVDWFQMLWLSDIIDEIKAVKAQVIRIVETKEDSKGVQYASQTPGSIMSQTSTPKDEEIVVALED
ncbi:hypothetical protein ACH5RR_036119 [Cinchona calisaya]|uniref:Uncharacterized protein n=1 Tax=Cinchona calisaya TaxID=153742 RepID=A0ABD2Y783_9GENT